MKKLLLFSLVVVYSSVSAQTVLYSENFETGNSFTLNATDIGSSPAADNLWVVNNKFIGGNGSDLCLMTIPINFTVPNSPTQPAGITNAPTSTYMHITSQIAINSGLDCASWVVPDGLCFNAGSYLTKMTNDISTVGSDSVTFNFWWMCGGDAVEYGEVYYSINGGSTWSQINHPSGGTEFKNEITWINMTLSDPAWAQQSTLRFAFRFVTAQASPPILEPSFAIDDITITGFSSSCSATTSNISASSCNSYTVPSGDETYTMSGTYMDTVPNASGCDSIMTINLTINNSTASSVSPTACDSYSSPSGNYTWTTSGTYMDTIPNSAGCDSVITVNLTINTGSSTTDSVTINAGDSLFVGNGWQTTSGTYVDTLMGVSGCDSVATTILTVDPGTGIDRKSLRSVSIYPNPTMGTVHLSGLQGPVIITVLDVMGREVFNTTEPTVDLGEQPRGVYFLRIETGEGIVTRKVIRR